MEINSTVRIVLEIGLGLLYLVGAIFNAVYTLRNSEEFFGSFAFVQFRLQIYYTHRAGSHTLTAVNAFG